MKKNIHLSNTRKLQSELDQLIKAILESDKSPTLEQVRRKNYLERVLN